MRPRHKAAENRSGSHHSDPKRLRFNEAAA